MKKVFYIFLITSVICCNQKRKEIFDYPLIDNVKIAEEHFGISYENSFSNIEDIKDSVVLKWFQQQDTVSERYFENKDFLRLYKTYDSLENKIADAAYNVIYNESGGTFFLSNYENDHSVTNDLLYQKKVNQESFEILFNPNIYKDGDYEIEYYKPSYDGRYVAIGMGKSDEFFNDLIILDCKLGEIVGRQISNTKPNKAGGYIWSPNSKCITYITYPDNNNKGSDRSSYTSIYCIDSLYKKPVPIFKDGLNAVSINEEYYPVPKFRSSNDNYAFIYEGNASDFWNASYLRKEDFFNGNFNWKKLYSTKDSIFHDWGIERNHSYFFKRKKDNNIELCVVDLKYPDFDNPKVLFVGSNEKQLSGFKVTLDDLYYSVTTNGIETSLYKYIKNGEDEKIALPIPCGELEFDFRSPYEKDLWITINGWTSNPKKYLLSKNNEFEFVKLGMWSDYPEFSNIISEIIEVESHDGVKIPLSLVRRKDHKMNASSMAIITAYGAYGMSETPWFHAPIADFVNKGNLYVSAHVRGGGEKGPQWHEAGFKSTKENSWKDLIACSEYLIKNQYIHPKKLGLNINSAGGITGGMAVNERPDLFGVFTGFVPSLNVIRTEYLEDFDDSDTTFEFGTIKEKESYKDLLKMDPVVNLIPEKDYPSTLMIIGFKDYLIPPSDAGKYIALLQSFDPLSGKPYLLDVKFDAEHETDWVKDYAKMLYFTMNELDKIN